MKSYKLKINNEKFEAKVKADLGSSVVVEVNGVDYNIELEKKTKKEKSIPKVKKTAASSSAPKTKPVKVSAGTVLAPIPGLVMKILVKVGDVIQVGDNILVLEAMKMESEIASNASGIVKSINVKEGDTVQEHEVLIEVGE
ncbi:MAG: acetyl-CoA carboxylase biotin carboxyl carrier protein subunit [Candidatus Cloacimonetes bacterium]|nr:acetyl-CoA carboxylase biotin carboxyl carrier protein subunit [Candidatus Cloacimonadota bacterium]MCF7815392.1 acetyl-CoA carboxylase biotin carboxyl carrier protein subunit [Candidatus Cloacimonadota bacterium]MCF7869476.1 acetyl-CoA carboxylase biotin carboxyl carrier protein subunit [Candidatus Cloacimonadota bacterium]MCF7883152.1 acetyl-CoA carboxylase biotin carboxyl carrier protein subunit [Candidatus Cloacimonadota bacterium]